MQEFTFCTKQEKRNFHTLSVVKRQKHLKKKKNIMSGIDFLFEVKKKETTSKPCGKKNQLIHLKQHIKAKNFFFRKN